MEVLIKYIASLVMAMQAKTIKTRAKVDSNCNGCAIIKVMASIDAESAGRLMTVSFERTLR